MDNLNPEQRSAAEAGDEPVLIVAGPGTGKTKTLTARIAYLLQNGASAGCVLALTFTKKAAQEMRQRVAALVPGGEQPHISTFHALCHELLAQHQPEPIVFVDESERLVLVKSLPRPAALKHLSAREAGLAISAAKNAPAIESEPLSKLVQAYNAALHETGLHDFDDLLLDTRNLLRDNDAVREQVSQRYTHILVDEFQDTNALQFELLHLLRSTDSVFAIGDPNQSIYGFRGAGKGMFAQFLQSFPNARQITLHVNYRSRPQIVRIANAVFPQASLLQAHSNEAGNAQAVEVLNEYSEANWVIGRIQQAIGGGDFANVVSDDERARHRRLSDFAVLYRSRSAAIALHKTFEQSGLPYQIVGEGSPYEQPAVRTVVKLFCSLATHERVTVKDLSENQTRLLLASIDAAQPPADIVYKLAELFGFEQTRTLTQLRNTLVRFDNVPAAAEYLARIAEQQFYDPQADAVTLLTIHAAKGLEFPHVCLIGANEGVLPHAKADAEEERRLFYVAVTRAREQLNVLHSRKRAGEPAQPSRFITQIDPSVLPRVTDENLMSDQRRARKRQLKRSQQSLF